MTYKERVTVVDVLDAGACYDGVVQWVTRNRGVIAGNASDHLGNEYIQKAANNGDGDGDGYGKGYGYGYGNGDGYGDGDGYGALS